MSGNRPARDCRFDFSLDGTHLIAGDDAKVAAAKMRAKPVSMVADFARLGMRQIMLFNQYAEQPLNRVLAAGCDRRAIAVGFAVSNRGIYWEERRYGDYGDLFPISGAPSVALDTRTEA